MNALLNFGYSLLEGRVRHAVNSVGFEPSVGWLDEMVASKLPAVYDLQEAFLWPLDLGRLHRWLMVFSTITTMEGGDARSTVRI